MNHPIHPSTLKLIEHAWCSIIAPPPKPRGLLEFCRTLKVWARNPDTGEDQWESFDPTGHPAQLEILQSFRLGDCEELVVLGPVQDGKTFATIICCLLYALIELRQSAGLMLPEQDKAEEIWLEKIVPVIRQSGYGWILPTEGRGSKSGAGRFIQLATGATVYLVGAGAKNESAQSSFTVRFMFIDEASGIRKRWIELAWGRTKSYDRNGRRVRTSTIKWDNADSTVFAYQDSTADRNWFRCPHCITAQHPSGGWQTFDFDTPALGEQKAIPFGRLHYDPDTDETARTTARLVCLHDPTHLITDGERRAALRVHRRVSAGQHVDAHGQVAGTALPNSRKGIRWCSLESPIKSLGKLATDLRTCLIARDRNGDHEPLRQYVRDECTQQYTGDQDAGDQHHVLRCTYLAARSSASTYALGRSERHDQSDSRHQAATLPDGVEWLTVGVDVNPGGERAPGRLYWLLNGGAGDARKWDLAWGFAVISPPGQEATEVQLHDGLDRLAPLLRDLAQDFARPLAPGDIGIDVGDRQDELRRWLVKHPDWTPVKDNGGMTLKVETQYSHNGNVLDKPRHRQDLAGWLHWRWQKDQKGTGWWLLIVDTDEVRHAAQTGFLVPAGSPGAHHLPSGLVTTDALIAHYCATGRIPDGKGGWRWATKKKDRDQWPDYQTRRDYLACRTYAHALDYRRRRLLTTPTNPQPRRTHRVVGKVGA